MVPFRWSLIGLIGLLALTGCSLSPTPPSGSIPHLKGIGGNIRGGQQPVSGATIQLYTVGTTGDGSAATPLLTSTVTSDANGNFQFGGLFSCTNATLVYLTATGGDPGLGANNPNLSMMTAIGPCTSITANTFVMIDERTTVAAISALAHFIGAAGSANIGSSPTDVSALTAAFTLSSELVDPSTGETPGQNVPAGMTVPSAEINTLADVLSTCINSAGGVAGDSSACGNLFSLTTPASATAPTNTIAALLNIANNPTLNTTALYNLNLAPGAGAPFQPELTTAPPDFQVRLTPPASSMTLQFDPTSVTFPDQAVGFASAPVSVTITNASSAAVTISSIGLVGPNATDFAQTNTCTSALQPTNSCTAQVTIKPAAVGTRTAYLRLASNASDSPQYLTLTGSGVAATAGPVTLSPSTLPTWGVAGESQHITLSNLGSTPLTISSITSSDPNFIPTSNCGTMLPAQSLCTIEVLSVGFGITPNANGYGSTYNTYNGTLTIDDNASTGPQTVQLQSTNGAQVSPPGADFGAWGVGNSVSRTFQYSTGQPYAPGSWYGGVWGDFTSTSCSQGPTQLSCSFTVTFKPSAAGFRTTGTDGVIFTGTGLPAGPSFTLGAGILPVFLSNVASATGSVYITNNGTTLLNFSSASLAISGTNASNFSVQPPSCTSLAPTATCAMNYGFTANSLGTYSAVMTITDTNSSTSQSVPLSVVVSYSNLVVSPSDLQFAYEPLGVTSAAQTFTITDSYMHPLGHPISVALPPSSNFVLPQGSSCPASATQVCTLSVALDPHQTGLVYAYLTVTDLTSGLTSKFIVQGYGGTPVVSPSPSPITFPARAVGTTSIPTTITLTNTGPVGLVFSNVNPITLVGAVNGNFTETNNCPADLDPGASCLINVTFAPTAAGPQSATIQILSNAPSSPDSIAISGTTN